MTTKTEKLKKYIFTKILHRLNPDNYYKNQSTRSMSKIKYKKFKSNIKAKIT